MSDLKRITELAELTVEKQDYVKRLKERLKDAEADLRRLSEEALPELMNEIGMTEFKLANGDKITLTKEVQVGVSEANRPRAMKWLVDNNFGGIVKTAVGIDFDRGERENAEELVERLQELFPERDIGVVENVHPSTLKSFVKERMKASDKIPMDLFGVRPYSKVKIKKA